MNTIDVDGVKLSYVEKGDGPTVVLSHGIIQDYRTWGLMTEVLSPRHRTICYSRRCSCPNQSRDFVGSTLESNTADLAGLIRELGGGPVDLVGHSYGGALAALCALEHPELVRNLVIIEPYLLTVLIREPYNKVHQLGAFFKYPSALRAGLRFLKTAQRPALRELDQKNNERAARLFVDGLEGRQNALDGYPEDIRRMMVDNAETIREMVNESPLFTKDEAKRIKAPTLLIKGTRSSVLNTTIVDELHQAMPNSDAAIISNAAHMVHLDNPRECNRVILEFLEKNR